MRKIVLDREALCARVAEEFAAAAARRPDGAFGFTAVDVPPEALEAIAASGADFSGNTGVMKLAEVTRRIAQADFADPGDVPTHGVTMGIGTLLAAKRILLVACGEDKANAAQKTLEGRPESFIPASFLQLHTDVTLLLDPDAASRL